MTRRGVHSCPALGCGRRLERWQRVCDPCWKLLPADLKRGIIAAKNSRNPIEVSERARAAVAWLAEHSPAAIAARQLGEAPP
jgi:hypothetical protein